MGLQNNYTHKGPGTKMVWDFSTATLQAKKKGSLQNSEGKNVHILVSAQLSIRYKDRIKTFSDI